MRTVTVPDDPAYARFGFPAAREAGGLLIASGQIGNLRGGMGDQIVGALDGVRDVLTAGGYELGDLLHLRILLTDVDAFIAEWEVVRGYFAPGDVPPNSLYPVTRLANPRSVIEIEATAFK